MKHKIEVVVEVMNDPGQFPFHYCVNRELEIQERERRRVRGCWLGHSPHAY